MKQETEITFEIEETIVLRASSTVLTAFCPVCGEPVLMVSPQAITAISGLTEREIFRLVETNKIHFAETGRILICLKSINELIKKIKL